MAYQISIQKETCIGCGNCAEACPATTARKIKSIEDGGESEFKPVLKVEHGASKLADKDGCGLCGVCIVACPSGAIDIMEE